MSTPIPPSSPTLSTTSSTTSTSTIVPRPNPVRSPTPTLSTPSTAVPTIPTTTTDPRVPPNSSFYRTLFLSKFYRTLPVAMPSAYTPAQKNAIAQFVSFTSAKDGAAAKTLKANGWNLQQAVEAFFGQSNGNSHAANSLPNPLNKLFDSYRDDVKNEPDRIGVEGSMRYLQDLGLKLDEPAVLAVLTELNAPTMGEFTRQGFIDGWTMLRADTLPKQKNQVIQLRNALTANPALFKKTYKATFTLARTNPSQKVLPLDSAIDHWTLLFSPPSIDWDTKTTPWLTWWTQFLQQRYKKGVSKDLWEQTAVFAAKSLEDESMGFWSEEGAWPSCIDDFVAFVREKRGGGAGEEMDVG